MGLSLNHNANISLISSKLRVSENFDVIERHLSVGDDDVCFFYIDGFTKDSEMQRLMQSLLALKKITSAATLVEKLPYIEVELCDDPEIIVRSVLSGQTAFISSAFPCNAILLDARTYPVRSTSEPDTDRVMQGARDGFVETLVMNTALIRRRIRDPRLTMKSFSMGGSSDTDVVVCYLDGVADKELVEDISRKLTEARPKGLCLGYQSLAECPMP